MTVSVAIMQLEVSGAYMQVTFSPAKILLPIFVLLMEMGVSVAVMWYSLQCVMHMTVSIVIMQASVSFTAM